MRNYFFLIGFAVLLACIVQAEEPLQYSFRPLTKSVSVFCAGQENTYLLRKDDRGVLFGASDVRVLEALKAAGLTRIEYVFLWNTRRDQVRALPEILDGCEEAFGHRPKVAAAKTIKGDKEAENVTLERSREFWELNAWRIAAGNVTTIPSDIPLFSLKPDFYFQHGPAGPMQVSWGGFTIDIVNTFSPHQHAYSFVLDDDKTVAISGRVVLKGGVRKRLFDFWTMVDRNFEDNLSYVEKNLEWFGIRRVELVLPEFGREMSLGEAEESFELLEKRIKTIGEMYPTTVRMTGDVYPGVRSIDLERDCYVINGGDKHFFLVNPGYPPALESLAEEFGAEKYENIPDHATIDHIFTTDCRDIHNVCAPPIMDATGAKMVATPYTARILATPRKYIFPNNSTKPTSKVKVVRHGESFSWRGAEFSLYELPQLGVGHQIMLMKTTGARVLFIGDALVNLRRFPFASPFISPDLRQESLERAVKLIAELQPTHIIDDWGIIPIDEPLDISRPMKWLRKYRALVLSLVPEQYGYRSVDPFWIRTVPDAQQAVWGTKVESVIQVRNFSDEELELELSLRGDGLKQGSDWSKELVLKPREVVRVPFTCTIDSEFDRSATCVAIGVTIDGFTTWPSQLILLGVEPLK